MKLEDVDFNGLKKIAVVGGSGSGKTTLANWLGEATGLPIVHLDGINYLPNWVPRDKEERDKMIIDETNKEKWIMDGTYTKTMKYRFEKADLIVWLDYPTIAKLYGVLRRYKKSDGKTSKPEIPGCVEKMDWEFFKWVLLWNKNKRPGLKNALSGFEDKTITFKTRGQLNRWFKKKFPEVKIEY